MTIKFIKSIVAGLIFSASCLVNVASAGLIQFSDRALFNAEGTIIENYGFEDFGSGFSNPGDPWTAHGVTYQTGENLIVGTDTSYNPISNVFAFNQWTPIVASISQTPAQFKMFGLDLGYIGDLSDITFLVSTNLSTYVYSGISAPLASQSLDFYGFVAGAGEYFTGFNLSSSAGSGSAPVIDNVTLGMATQIPEPSTIAILALGMMGLASRRLKNQS